MSIAYTKNSWSKKEMFEQLRGFNIHTVRATINRVIAEKREIPLSHAKDQKILKPSEAEIVLNEFA